MFQDLEPRGGAADKKFCGILQYLDTTPGGKKIAKLAEEQCLFGAFSPKRFGTTFLMPDSKCMADLLKMNVDKQVNTILSLIIQKYHEDVSKLCNNKVKNQAGNMVNIDKTKITELNEYKPVVNEYRKMPKTNVFITSSLTPFITTGARRGGIVGGNSTPAADILREKIAGKDQDPNAEYKKYCTYVNYLCSIGRLPELTLNILAYANEKKNEDLEKLLCFIGPLDGLQPVFSICLLNKSERDEFFNMGKFEYDDEKCFNKVNREGRKLSTFNHIVETVKTNTGAKTAKGFHNIVLKFAKDELKKNGLLEEHAEAVVAFATLGTYFKDSTNPDQVKYVLNMMKNTFATDRTNWGDLCLLNRNTPNTVEMLCAMLKVVISQYLVHYEEKVDDNNGNEKPNEIRPRKERTEGVREARAAFIPNN